MTYISVLPGGDHDLRYGYTLNDVNRIARTVVRRYWSTAADMTDRLETAWSAVAEHLYAADQPVAEHDLYRAAERALGAVNYAVRKDHGVNPRSAFSGDLTAPGFLLFWHWQARHTAGPEHVVVDRIALWQIWPQLSAVNRRAFLLLAAHHTYQDAAAAMGIRYGSFIHRISHARREFLALWHQGELPSRPWGHDRRQAAGPTDGRKPRTATAKLRRRSYPRSRAAAKAANRTEVA